MSTYTTRDPHTGNLLYLRRCVLCHALEEDTGVDRVEVHADPFTVREIDLCRRCEAEDFDKAEAYVADLEAQAEAVRMQDTDYRLRRARQQAMSPRSDCGVCGAPSCSCEREQRAADRAERERDVEVAL